MVTAKFRILAKIGFDRWTDVERDTFFFGASHIYQSSTDITGIGTSIGIHVQSSTSISVHRLFIPSLKRLNT